MRNRAWQAGAVLVLLLCLCGLAQGAAPDNSFIATIPALVSNPPPLNPAGEHVVPNDPAFSRECLQMIPALRKNIRMERALTTEAKPWGLVLRIDFVMAAAEMQTITGRVNRLVFWRGAGGTPFVLIAVGQSVPPLPR